MLKKEISKRVYHFRELMADIVQLCSVRLGLDRIQNVNMSCTFPQRRIINM
jgi:hypothetical protein